MNWLMIDNDWGGVQDSALLSGSINCSGIYFLNKVVVLSRNCISYHEYYCDGQELNKLISDW